jgi:hypothetical protein
MPLLERRIARTVRAKNVFESPAVTGRQNRGAQLATPPRTLTLGTGIDENVSNFPQDSLRAES